MKFNPKARLDTKQIRDRRGRATSGGGGLPGLPTGGGGLPSGLPVGGGVVGVIIALVIAFVVWKSGGGAPSGSSASTAAGTSSDSDIVERCQTGADANKYEDCAIVADVNSIQSYWNKALPQQTGTTYTEVPTTWFTRSTSTGCGNATSAVGPFYCPADKVVYIDLTFFHDMLQGQLGAAGGPFAEAYVLAHEYGHHVQDLLGTMDQVKTQQGPKSDSVRLELQADCFAGIWAKYATRAQDAGGQPFILDLTTDDINRALDSARAVGDDRIQQQTSGRVDPDQWTHGSSAERQHWFMVGMTDGTIKACDTFGTDNLDG
jgi:predicted metalloprotease